ncbi:hypothetical protein [Bradyrhizobium sp.]|uniref:hypothetical protein n=1 Tax=Bradyrhizobium sp. TaxID=376 RepID=UPI003C6037A5
MKLVKVSAAIEIVSVATGKPQQRRVAILQRDDGHFTFAEEYAYKSEYEGEIIAEGWRRLPSEGIFASAEIAEAEGHSAFLRRHKRQSG